MQLETDEIEDRDPHDLLTEALHDVLTAGRILEGGIAQSTDLLPAAVTRTAAAVAEVLAHAAKGIRVASLELTRKRSAADARAAAVRPPPRPAPPAARRRRAGAPPLPEGVNLRQASAPPPGKPGKGPRPAGAPKPEATAEASHNANGAALDPLP